MAFLHEGAELVAESGITCFAVKELGRPNEWAAVHEENCANIFMLKAPENGEETGKWPRFVHEMIMHELFKGSPHIHTQVDQIAPDKDKGLSPILVLEMMETTVGQASAKRPLSIQETRSIVQSVLYALKDIHKHDLVYDNLELESVLLNGFDADVVSNGSQFVVKLGNLGSIAYPTQNTPSLSSANDSNPSSTMN